MKSASQSVDNLSQSYNKASDSISSSVNELSDSYAKASGSISSSAQELSKSYVKASNSIEALSVSNEDSQTYNDQVQKVSKNLSALNAVYELQLQGTNDHLKATNKLFDGIEEVMKNLNESVEGTRKYKDEIATLSENLTALNTVYGNMLTAMNFKK